MNVAWFSPLPPMRTGIALNAVPVVRELATRAAVTLWVAGEESVAARDLPVQRYTRHGVDWPRLNESGIAIYQVGNHAHFHGDLFHVSRRHSGVVVLHDESLQPFFEMLLRGDGDDTYVHAMAHCHGEEGLRAARDYIAGARPMMEMAAAFPMTRLAVERSCGVVVHNRDVVERLRAVFDGPIAYLPLAHPATQPAPGRPAPAPAPGGEWRVVVAGHIGVNRCLPQILQVLAEPAFDRLRLDVIGEVAEADRIARHIAQLGVGARVDLHGFVADDAMARLLDRAHLAINLRNPTMGEASASQLLLWDFGLPVIVSRTGWYAGLPRDAVHFVEPGEEVEGLRRAFEEFLLDPARFAAMGRAGRRTLEQEHDPARYVDGLLELCAEARAWRASAAASVSLERCAAELAHLDVADLACHAGVASALSDLFQSPLPRPQRPKAAETRRNAATGSAGADHGRAKMPSTSRT